MDPNYEIEYKSASLGFNPKMGGWELTIPGRPVPYSCAHRDEKERWQNEIRKAIGGNRSWIYSHQVSLSVELSIDYQSIIETNEIADLDNYAKLICDSLKGSEGIVIDDCQFQHLDISWIDAPNKEHELVLLRFRAAPDDFLVLPIRIYEMSDSLFYPFSDYRWTPEGPIAISFAEREKRLVTADAFTRVKKQMRHTFREAGSPQFRSFQKTMPLWDHISVIIGEYASIWGFNKSRVVDSGFEIIPYQKWATAHQDAVAQTAKIIMESLQGK